MLKLKTEELELRGVKDEVSQKTKKTYYIVYCEDFGGESFKFLCRDRDVFPQGLDKGNKVILTLKCNQYNNLEVEQIEKVGE